MVAKVSFIIKRQLSIVKNQTTITPIHSSPLTKGERRGIIPSIKSFNHIILKIIFTPFYFVHLVNQKHRP